jgi:hypothetical protein
VEKTLGLGWTHITMRRIRTVCWITKTTNTHSEYVTLIIAVPLLTMVARTQRTYVA